MVQYVIEGAFALGVVGLIWKIALDSEHNTNLIFRRFDEYKETIKKEHVNKDVCKIIHEQLCVDVKEMKSDIKEIIRVQRNGG